MPAGAVSFGEFAVKLATFTAELSPSMIVATNKAALHITNSVRDQVRADSGGDMRLSGVGLRGARVGARYDVKGIGNPTALVRATGPMQLLERDTSAHVILPRRRRGKRAILTPDGPRRSAHHPGTSGKRTWSKAVERVVDDVPRIYQAELRNQLRKFFG